MTHLVQVWDKFVRVFHWSLVALFITSYLTGENEHWSHIYSGYSITTLIMLRVIWGFIGSKHARFKDFVSSPATIISYVRAITSGHPKRFLGHNPAGGAMIILLLATLLGTTLSGMKLLAIEENKGPFSVVSVPSLIQPVYADTHEYSGDDLDEYSKGDHEDVYNDKDSVSEKHDEQEAFWEEIHEVCISLMLLFITLHVVGVIVASRQHNESLVKAMITGQKEQDR